MLATFGLQSINFVAAPLLAASFHGGRIPEFRNLLNTSMRYSSLWAFPVCLLAFLAPQQLLGLFGAEFRGGVEVLQILSIGQCVNAVTGTTGIALMMIGRETAVAASIGVALVVSVMLQIWTWPVFGIAGVAVVSAGCVAALNLLHWFLVRAVANRSALP
jgi:O-antigen/teichoic acid export membrane protein